MNSAAFDRSQPATLPLMNGTQFASLVDRCLARARRESKPLAVLSLTVDHVGLLGEHPHLSAVAAAPHEQAVLEALAQRLRCGVRSNDEVVQLGGHDLGVVLLCAGPNESALVAARLQRVLGGSYHAHGLLLGAKLRIGVACSSQHGMRGSELVRAGAAALAQSDAFAFAARSPQKG